MKETLVIGMENLISFSILFLYCHLKLGNDGISYRTFIKQQVSEKQFFPPLYLLVCILQKNNYFDLIKFFLLKSAGTQ